MKFYSVFTALNVDTQEEMHFMLMGSITKNIPKKYLMRIYDLKGSYLNRRVLRDSEDEESEESKRTLKDIDFERL